MKAVVLKKYGLPEQVLELTNITVPIPKENEVLVKIMATAINDYDWSLVRGKPHLYRLMFGLFKPKHAISGMELSGIVEKVGVSVKNLKVGDAVFGDTSAFGFGTFAEYMSVNENALIKKPDYFSFEEATAIPHAALLALQALKYFGNIKQNQSVLINGGGGGVGTIGLQLAKLYNCEVTGVDTGEKLDMMLSIGYDHVLDYKKVDFTKTDEQYDLILDCKSNKSAFAYVRNLNPTGKYITIGGKLFSVVKIMLWSKIIHLFSKKRLYVLPLKPNKGLEYICELFKDKKLKCEIDGPYAMEDIPRLVQYFGEGKHKGKIVIKMNYN